MLNIRRRIPGIGILLLSCAALLGCSPKTNVSATGDVPAQYPHVYVTVQEIWFNASATAGPADTAWIKFPLTTPVTVDLASAVGGTLGQITTGLGLPAGTYAQVRLIPVDTYANLVASAQSLGALYNSQVDSVDATGTAYQSPLELQNPDVGIGIATSLTVKADVSGVFSTNSDTTANPSGITTDGTDTTGATTTSDTTTTDSTGTSITTDSGTSSSSSSGPFSMAINVDAARDVVPFTYGGTSGMLLNPHLTAYDTSTVGSIQGSLTLSGLTGVTSPGGGSYVNIQVTAESLSADGTRHVVVNSTPVRSDGTFVLYPLSTTPSSTTSYDLVIHGPGIATIIVKGVPVSAGDPASTTPVSIGTIVPRTATSFTVNLTPTTTPLPAGALVGFYRTLPGSGEVPYLIEERPIDPFSRTFSADQAIATGTVDSGTFVSGSNVPLTTFTPVEGASTYRVSATAPLFADGTLTTTVSAPAKSSKTAVLVSVPTLAAAAGAVFNSLSVVVTPTTPGKYNQGQLMISHDGAIVATATLDSALTLARSTTFSLTGLPGGTGASPFDAALYSVSVRTWNSSNPAKTLNREIYPATVDLSNGSTTGYSISID